MPIKPKTIINGIICDTLENCFSHIYWLIMASHNVIDCSHIKKQNSRNPNYIADVYIDFDTERLCAESTALIKNWLFGGYYCAVVPNAPKTIQHKGFNLPLVETGQLVNSISAKAVFGRGKY